MEPTPTRRGLLKTVGAGAALAVTGVAVDAASAGEWPALGYDAANTGYNPEATGPKTDVGGAWRFETDDRVTSSPAVANAGSGQRIYVGSNDARVHAIDANGEQAWTFETGNRVRSSPAVFDGTVYVGSDDGSVYAIENGEEQWRFETEDAVVSSPAVVDIGTDAEPDRRVYIGSNDANIYAIDADEGVEEWRSETGSAVESSPAVALDDEGGGTVYVGSEDTAVYALDARDGSQEWVFPTDNRVVASPAVADGRVFVGNHDNVTYALNAASGEEVWRVEGDDLGRIVASPAVAGNTVYVASRSGTVRALSVSEGEERWTFDADSTPILGGPSIASDTLYFGTEGSTVFGVDPASGEERWRFGAASSVRSSPAVVDGPNGGRVYVGGGTSVYALAEGAELPAPDTANTGDGGFDFEDVRFLLVPASAVAFVAAVAGGLYAASRVGLLDRVETAADAVGPDPEDAEYDIDEESDDTDADDGATQVWEVVIDDVIGRADQAERTATEDIVVGKYVDADTLDSPVVAYEIESLRDAPVLVRLTEPVFEDTDADSRPLGDNWTVEDGTLVFEQVLDPDETVRTIVGRPDCPADRLDELRSRPTIAVEEV